LGVAFERGFGGFVVEVAGEGVVGEACGGTGFCLGEALAFAIEDQFAVIDEFHAVGLGEELGSFSHKVDVRALFEDEARGVDGIAEAFDTGNAAGLHAASVHEERVELDAAVGGEEAAAAGVEGGIVFEDGDGGLDGIDGCAAAGEDLMADSESVTDSGLVRFGCVGGDGPSSAMDEQSWVVGGGMRDHSDMVVHRCSREIVKRGGNAELA